MFIHLRDLGQDEASVPAANEANVQPVAPDQFDLEQAAGQIQQQASSWWASKPEYERQAIITGATSALVFYWMSRILGSVFGNR